MIRKNGKTTLIRNGANIYSFSIASSVANTSTDSLVQINSTSPLVQYPQQIAGYQIVPHGAMNKFPVEIRRILDENNLTSEVLNKKVQLLWGQGPATYRVEYVDGVRKKVWEHVPEIQAWLDAWEWEEYVLKATVETTHMNGHYSKYYRNRGARIGEAAYITHLEHVGGAYARLEWPDQYNKVRAIITGDYEKPWHHGLRRYPKFNRSRPFASPVAMHYSSMYTFAMDNEYSRIPFQGSLNWITLGSSIATLLANFNENSAAIKYHIESPAAYWESKKADLMEECALKDKEYNDQMLEELKDQTYLAITEAMAGAEKAGKMISTESIFDEKGNQYVGWKITPLDQKVKDFIDGQINIAKRADFSITAGLGLHPALSNISADGNLPSGSEQLYAFKLFLLTGVDIPEMIVCRDINYAIAANFPGTPYRIGFYHDAVVTEEQTSEKNRIKNN